MKQQMKEERNHYQKEIEEIKNNLMKMKEEVEEIITTGKIDQCVKREEYTNLIESYNTLVNQHNEIYSNYVKKNELDQLIHHQKEVEDRKRKEGRERRR